MNKKQPATSIDIHIRLPPLSLTVPRRHTNIANNLLSFTPTISSTKFILLLPPYRCTNTAYTMPFSPIISKNKLTTLLQSSGFSPPNTQSPRPLPSSVPSPPEAEAPIAAPTELDFPHRTRP